MSIWGTGLIKGLVITMKNMLRGPITVQYPKEKVTLPERARWTVEPTLDDEGNIKCTACLTCVRACPDHVLDMQLTVGEDKSKHIDHFRYESAACMMCGLCVEACPFDAIHQSHDYELARIRFSELTYDLLTDVDAAKPKRKSAEGAAKPAPKPAAAPADGADAPAKPEAAPAEASPSADAAPPAVASAGASDTPADDPKEGTDG